MRQSYGPRPRGTDMSSTEPELALPPATVKLLTEGINRAHLRVRRLRRTGGEAVYPMCTWADDNTNASVAEITPQNANARPESLDLAAAARTTLAVREEMRRPIN